MTLQFRTALIPFAATLLAVPASAQDLRSELSADMPALMDLYRDLHAHPELSFQEFETSKKLAGRMRDLGFAVTEGVGKTGVVAVMENGEGPVLLLRTDMDALPVTEQTGLPFASQERGVPESGVESGIMHACGHDTHMTAWIGAAQLLSRNRDGWQGTLVMIAQPAEEVGQGSKTMLEDGLFSRFPKPDYAVAFHDAAQYPAGMIGYVPGYAMANVDSVDITVYGAGGHGAYPHTTKDPIVLGSAIVTRLQTLVSRESNPTDPSVVTVGSFHAGTKHNVIPDEAKLQLTVRSYSDESRKLLLDGITRIARGEGVVAGLAEDKLPDVKLADQYTPAVYNTPEFAERAMGLLTQRFGADRVKKVTPVMGGEDFSRYRRADPDNVQSLLFWVGGVPQEDYEAAQAGEKTLPSLHSALWAPEAATVIATAAESLAAIAMDVLARDGG